VRNRRALAGAAWLAALAFLNLAMIAAALSVLH
jgi:hypothetical protein